jgi:hypothetical protein
MKFAYLKSGWRARAIRRVADDYEPQAGEFVIERDAMPTYEELSDAPPAPSPIEVITETEQRNPITHRALREFFIGFGEAQPAFKETLLYKRVKAVDDAIKAERAKL